jgi:hypothetical protein
MRSNGSAAMKRTFDDWPAAREIILFMVGLIGIGWETVHGPVEPSLLVVFTAMCGIPIVLHKDKK